MQENDGDAHISHIGALLGDPKRALIIMALMDGRALAATTLAQEVSIAPSTVSGHLHKLVDGGILACERQGKKRYYRLSSVKVGVAIEALTSITPTLPVRSLDEATHAYALRFARSCYDHLAGRLGVELLDSLVKTDKMRQSCETNLKIKHSDPILGAGGEYHYELTEKGMILFNELGVNPVRNTRPLTRYCIDWSEQRPHLGGSLGAALLVRLLELRWLRRPARGRVLILTPLGRTEMCNIFGIERSELALKPYTKR